MIQILSDGSRIKRRSLIQLGPYHQKRIVPAWEANNIVKHPSAPIYSSSATLEKVDAYQFTLIYSATDHERFQALL